MHEQNHEQLPLLNI